MPARAIVMSGLPSERTRTDPTRSSRRRRGMSRLRGARPSERTRSRSARSSPDQTKNRVGRTSTPPSRPSWISSERSAPRTRSGSRSRSSSVIRRRLYRLEAVRRPALLLSLLAALALAFVAPARAEDPPAVKARAVLVADASSGEVLYARDADRRLPMASITKIMTALLTLERADPDDVVTVGDSAPAIGESTIHLRPGGARLPPPLLFRERRAHARPGGDGAPPLSPHRETARPPHRGRPRAAHLERPPAGVPRHDRRQDRPHRRRRLEPGGRGDARRRHHVRRRPRRSHPRAAERRPRRAARLGLRPVRPRPARRGRPALRDGARALLGRAARPRRDAGRLGRRPPRPPARRACRRSRGRRAPGRARPAARLRRRQRPRARDHAPAARRRARDRRTGLRGARRLVRWPRSRRGARHARRRPAGNMIVTVTLNAAIDRTLLVPNFQLGQRHRASASLSSAGGKGINVARALKRLGIPVVCAGLAGGRTGVQIVERLTSEGLLNDFVRIKGESRTSTAVVDPTSNVYTEINEYGPEVEDH